MKDVRKLEDPTRKVSRHRNDLVLRCKDTEVTRPCLSRKCPINTTNARRIVDKARKDLVRERVGMCHKQPIGHAKSLQTRIGNEVVYFVVKRRSTKRQATHLERELEYTRENEMAATTNIANEAEQQ